MAIWAYPCRPCAGTGSATSSGTDSGAWMVSQAQVDEMPRDVTILRVKNGHDWVCARVDRSRPLAIEGQLLREAVASDGQDCPDCATPRTTVQAAAAAEPAAAAAAQVHVAAISLQGHRFVVVLTRLDVVRSAGEADMLQTDLQQRLGGADVVLMGQAEDGTPEYHGDPALLALLADLPVDRMPWRSLSLG